MLDAQLFWDCEGRKPLKFQGFFGASTRLNNGPAMQVSPSDLESPLELVAKLTWEKQEKFLGFATKMGRWFLLMFSF